jgi:hypothetical protein
LGYYVPKNIQTSRFGWTDRAREQKSRHHQILGEVQALLFDGAVACTLRQDTGLERRGPVQAEAERNVTRDRCYDL